MIFAYSGCGAWIVAVFVGTFLVLAGVAKYTHLLSPSHSAWVLPIPFAVTALFCGGLAAHSRCAKPRLTLERLTGRERLLRPRHTLYWISAEYWSLVFLALAGWLATRR